VGRVHLEIRPRGNELRPHPVLLVGAEQVSDDVELVALERDMGL
jgi:hypothetical protein